MEPGWGRWNLFGFHLQRVGEEDTVSPLRSMTSVFFRFREFRIFLLNAGFEWYCMMSNANMSAESPLSLKSKRRIRSTICKPLFMYTWYCVVIFNVALKISFAFESINTRDIYADYERNFSCRCNQ